MLIEKFLKLPDWQKVELKKSRLHLSKYPLMTRYQQNNRNIKILEICAKLHGSENYEEFAAQMISCHDFWPKAIERWLTPKLLDFVNIDLFLQFCNCYCCSNFHTEFKRYDIRLKVEREVYASYGFCNRITKKKITYKKNCCNHWNPLKFYEDMIDLGVIKVVDFVNDYNYDDYLRDLDTIHFWSYIYGE